MPLKPELVQRVLGRLSAEQIEVMRKYECSDEVIAQGQILASVPDNERAVLFEALACLSIGPGIDNSSIIAGICAAATPGTVLAEAIEGIEDDYSAEEIKDALGHLRTAYRILSPILREHFGTSTKKVGRGFAQEYHGFARGDPGRVRGYRQACDCEADVLSAVGPR